MYENWFLIEALKIQVLKIFFRPACVSELYVELKIQSLGHTKDIMKPNSSGSYKSVSVPALSLMSVQVL